MPVMLVNYVHNCPLGVTEGDSIKGLYFVTKLYSNIIDDSETIDFKTMFLHIQ